MMRWTRTHFWLILCVLWALLGCSCRPRGSFLPTPPPVGPQTFENVLEAIVKAPPRTDRPVAVGLVLGGEKTPGKLYAWDLAAGRALWELSTKALSTPHVFGNYVVTEEQERGIFVVRNLENGEELFLHENPELHIVGGDGEGDIAVIGLSTGSEDSAYSTLLVVRNGQIAWRLSVGFAIGPPCYRGELIFIPWATQTLSVLDATNGRQVYLTRIDDVLGHTFVDQGNVYLGQHSVFRFTKSFEAGLRDKAVRYSPMYRPLPGQPPLLRDPYETPNGPQSAVYKVQLAFRPTGEEQEISLLNDSIYYHFYRLVFALESERDEIRWAYQNADDLVGMSVQPGGILLADASGTLFLLDAQRGNLLWQIETAQQPTFVRFRAHSFNQSGGNQPEPETLEDQLIRVAKLSDNQITNGRVYAIGHLARIETEKVTEELISICGNATNPSPVRVEACRRLGERTVGSTHVLNALKRRSRWLHDEVGPPVGPLAQAAEKMKIKQAVPLLEKHLADPHTEDRALPPLMSALKELGTRSTMTQVEQFLLLYHANPSNPGLTKSLVTAVEAVATHRGKSGIKLLNQIAEDSMTVAEVRVRAVGLLTQLEAPPPKSRPTLKKNGSQETRQPAPTRPATKVNKADPVKASQAPRSSKTTKVRPSPAKTP